MTSRRSTARSRDIGQELLAIREKAGFDGLGLADRLGWDQSKVSRIEGGKQAVDELDLIHWLSTCGVKRPRMRQLVEHNREALKEFWIRSYGPGSNVLATEELAAKAITYYACGVMPGLLQTPEYARMATSCFANDEQAVERAVVQRMGRQELLRGEKSPKVTFFIEERVLRSSTADPAVMHDQLMHLMFMADWKKVSIRVLRIDGSVHSGGQGSFTLIERRDGRWLAWIDTRATALILESDEHIQRYKETIKELSGLAMTEEASRAYIARLAGGVR